jgi:hypothetical protein
MLAVSVLAFAAWLKISPSLTSSYRAEATQLTKLWVDPTQGWETQVKLAPVGIVLFFFAPVLSLVLVRVWSWHSGMTPRSAARDIFTESRHWFRPPPLF